MNVNPIGRDRAAPTPHINSGERQDAIDLSVVVPVYKSARTLPELISRLRATIEQMGLSFEILLVEDCGGDDSWQVVDQLAAADLRIRGIQLSRNFGQHAATICGFSHSRGRWVATLDDDLEQLPEHLPRLYEQASAGNDLVYGIYPERTHSKWRNFTSAVAQKAFKAAIPTLNYKYSSYRLIRGKIARQLDRFDSPFPFVDGYLSWVTGGCKHVFVEHGARHCGKSNYTLRKLLVHTANIFVTFSDLPLKFATWAGMITFTFGLAWLSLIVWRYVTGGISVSGYPSLMGAVLIFGGIQLLVLGIFGEYISRINFKSSRKPLFLVGRSTWDEVDRD